MFDTQVDPAAQRRLEEAPELAEEFPHLHSVRCPSPPRAKSRIWRTSSEPWAALASTVSSTILWSALVANVRSSPTDIRIGESTLFQVVRDAAGQHAEALDALGALQFLFEMLAIS